MCYKMLHGVLDIYVSSFVLIDVMYTRGNCKSWQNLAHFLSVMVMFPMCIVNIWNSLPDNVVSATSISSFKHRLAYVCLSVLS